MTGATHTAEPPLTHVQVPQEEFRLALVLNGGVSLAVWMGGVAREIDALVRADGNNPGAEGYGAVHSVARTFSTVDVISGTSAGGINGACLALSLANQNGKLDLLRDLWAEQGRMDNLLRPPFRGQPTSLLRGDDYFLPELTRAMRNLAANFVPTQKYSVDLTITATLLSGATSVTTDGLGQRLPQRRHGANFRFSTDHRRDHHNDFDADNIAETCTALGLASRCTAGFPFAFEPTFVPVEMPSRGREEPARTVIDGRPNMWRWASWAESARDAAEYAEQAQDLSRYAVDGGVLANTPTRQALDAVDRRPAGKPLRRGMLLVFPHAPVHDPAADPADMVAEAPTVGGTVGGLLGSLTSQGSLTFVEEIDAHNRRALGWRGGRERLLESFTLEEIYGLVATGWEFYTATRIQAAARSLTERVPRPEGWDFARVVAACRGGQTTWRGRHHNLPYVPTRPLVRRPRLGTSTGEATPEGSSVDRATSDPALEKPAPDSAQGWGWGTTVALGIADAAAQMLFAAQSLVRTTTTDLDAALRTVSDARDELLRARDEFDDWWWHRPALGPVLPDAEYWALRLDCYHHGMQDPEPPDPQAAWIREAVERLHGYGRPLDVAERDAIEKALVDRTRPNPIFAPSDGRTLGSRTKEAVDAVIGALAGQAPLLRELAPLSDRHEGLAIWGKVVDQAVLPGEPTDPHERLRTRLLSLDAATWMLADAESPGTSQEISLAQLSLVIDHWWAEKSKTPDDKVAGTELSRFGGFLKQSWRINDWIWGRLDAAQMLCRLVLEPRRLYRIHVLTRASAEQVVGMLLTAAYGDAQGPSYLADLRKAAVAEVNTVFNGGVGDRGFLPEIAALAAYPIQQQIAVTELPSLARAIREDEIAGGNPRSRGRVFLENEAELLTALDAGGADLWVTRGREALEAFDRAGIGREPLDEESRSDAMIQTAVTAAAAMVTVADSDRFGPGVLKPLTKTVRGAALVPYWLVTGLLSGSRAARTIVLLGFAVGGLALLLGLFGLLGAFSAAATTVGAGVVVAALAFAALRSGTLFHGAVLLGAAVPLVALAAPVMHRVSGSDDASAKGSVVSLGTVTVIVVGMMLLASLPNPVRSPVATVAGAARRARREAASWNAKRVVGWTAGLAGAAAAVGLACWFLVDRFQDEAWFAEALWAAAVVVSVVSVVIGTAVARLRVRGMRRWTQGTDQVWHRERQVSAPSGVSAGWSVVYGAGFLGLAWATAAVLTYGSDSLSDASTSQLVVLAWWAALGLLLTVAGASWITARARRKVERTIRRESMSVTRPPWNGDFQLALESRGLLFDYMTTGSPPQLTARSAGLKYVPTAGPSPT